MEIKHKSVSRKSKICPCCSQVCHSTLGVKKCTFGSAARFNNKVTGIGAHTPGGNAYYARSFYLRGDKDRGRSASLGVSDRPHYVYGAPNVGPGSYKGVPSVCRRRSALDGPEYSITTMKPRLDYCVGELPKRARATFPGPGYYKVPTTVGDALKYSIRHYVNYCDFPHVTSRMSETGDFEKTFGKFNKGVRKLPLVASSAPEGDLFYAHSRILTEKDYMKESRTCTLGKGKRADFAQCDYDAAPGSYDLDPQRCPRCDSMCSI